VTYIVGYKYIHCVSHNIKTQSFCKAFTYIRLISDSFSSSCIQLVYLGDIMIMFQYGIWWWSGTKGDRASPDHMLTQTNTLKVLWIWDNVSVWDLVMAWHRRWQGFTRSHADPNQYIEGSMNLRFKDTFTFSS